MTNEQVWKLQWRFTLTLVVIAVALALSALIIEVPDRRWWATTLQLVGAIVAAAGFANAYVRARYSRSLGGQIIVWGKQFGAYVAGLWRRLLRRPRNFKIDVPLLEATASGIGSDSATVTRRYAFDPAVPLDDQLRSMAAFLNDIAGMFPALETQIADLNTRINEVATHSEKAAADTLTCIQEQIAALSAQLDRQQVLDLRWAIGGLFITALGIALSY